MESVVVKKYGNTNRDRVIRRLRRLYTLERLNEAIYRNNIKRGNLVTKNGHDVNIMMQKRLRAIRWALAELRHLYSIEWGEIDTTYRKEDHPKLQNRGTTTNTDTPQ